MYNSRYKKASSRIARRERGRRNAALILKVGLPVIFLIGFVMLLRADFLQIKGFEVSGEQNIPKTAIEEAAKEMTKGARFGLVPNSNIFVVKRGEMAAALLSKFGRIEKADIKKNIWEGKIKITVRERASDFLWCNDKCFFMDSDGLVFESRLEGLSYPDLVIFRGGIEGDPFMKNFASAEQMGNYKRMIETFKNGGVAVSSINIENGSKGTVSTDAGEVIFSPQDGDLSLAAQNSILLLNNIKSKNPSARFQYIDARSGNKLFYKLK